MLNEQQLVRAFKTLIVDKLIAIVDLIVAGGGGSTEQIQSDWTQTDTTHKDFIKNKPFDVASNVVIKENVECENAGDNLYSYSEEELPTSNAWLTVNDVGKTLSVILDEIEYQGTVFNNDGVYTVLINMGAEDDPIAYPCFKIFSSIIDDLAYNVIMLYVDPDGETPESKIISYLGFKSVSKLSGDKVQIDGESIVSDNGVLKAVGGDYELPVASANTLGGVKIGTGVNVAEDGTISVNTPAPTPAGWTLVAEQTASASAWVTLPDSWTNLLIVTHDVFGSQGSEDKLATFIINKAVIPSGTQGRNFYAGNPKYNFQGRLTSYGCRVSQVFFDESDITSTSKFSVYVQ